MQDKNRIDLLEDALEAYVTGRSGIPYEQFVLFAEPLFEVFEADLRSSSNTPDGRRIDELSTMLSILDTARLFWAYFRLTENEAVIKFPVLKDCLLGKSHSEEDEAALVFLMSKLEERWVKLDRSDDGQAGIPGYSVPAFEHLLEAFVTHEDICTTEAPDALADFARPLFDAVDVTDPAAVEDAFARAQAYWDLAQLTGAEYDRQLQALVHRFSGSRRSGEDVRTEAEAMAVRFKSLFS